MIRKVAEHEFEIQSTSVPDSFEHASSLLHSLHVSCLNQTFFNSPIYALQGVSWAQQFALLD